jgi:hypothetical protein
MAFERGTLPSAKQVQVFHSLTKDGLSINIPWNCSSYRVMQRPYSVQTAVRLLAGSFSLVATDTKPEVERVLPIHELPLIVTAVESCAEMFPSGQGAQPCGCNEVSVGNSIGTATRVLLDYLTPFTANCWHLESHYSKSGGGGTSFRPVRGVPSVLCPSFLRFSRV